MTRSATPFKLTPLAALCVAGSAFATNGMNMEGYGPISTGMGGASQAFDHGTAALAQNPATLALMPGGSRLDVALGRLGPDITSSMPGMPAADSDGTSYIMPALGFARRSGAFTYGFGVFAQGGMGTEYGANTFLALGTGEGVRSELGVGRAMVPLAFQVTPEFAVGGSLDLVWAGLDLRMAVPGAQLAGLVTGGNIALPPVDWARVDFSNSSDFSGAAKATGWAGKIGAVYKASPEVTLGASYHLKTKLDDLETSSSGASLSACPSGAVPTAAGRKQAQALTCTAGLIPLTGKVTVLDFQWPATTAVGASWQASPALLLAADLKYIEWSKVMKSFRMRFDGPGGATVSFTLPQDWKDQTVVNLGAAWKASDALTLRAGLNLAENPIPDATVNPLFPATIKNHITAGLGYSFSPVSEFNGSLTVAPKVSVTNAQGVTIDHRQFNVQLMYTHRF
jgi:long-chain fatty acid transport protein